MNDDKMLDWVEFVTDKFARNHKPWKYSRDVGDLKHIRYESDYTGYDHWRKRLGRFFREVLVRHWRTKNVSVVRTPNAGKSFWYNLKTWPRMVRVHWQVSVMLEDNRPDGQLDEVIITHWEEDGEYIAMFCPYVGREVLKFLRADPDNPFAQEILRAMRESMEVSWPSEESSSNS